jgi:hypothetical protein
LLRRANHSRIRQRLSLRTRKKGTRTGAFVSNAADGGVVPHPTHSKTETNFTKKKTKDLRHRRGCLTNATNCPGEAGRLRVSDGEVFPWVLVATF